MFTAINIDLQSISNGYLPGGHALYIHGFFFNLLRETNEKISEELHNNEGVKPFTLSMLKGLDWNNGDVNVNSKHNYSLRATFMDEQVFLTFYDALYNCFKQKRPVQIGEVYFYIILIEIEKCHDINDLMTAPQANYQKFMLQFISPTSFRMRGVNHIFPDTSSVFKSYSNKWNIYFPESTHITKDDLELISTYCYPVRHNLYTEMVEMGKYKVGGFKGWCWYEVKKQMPEQVFQKMHRLLLFSRYTGTGYKTTMGMGQTRVVF